MKKILLSAIMALSTSSIFASSQPIQVKNESIKKLKTFEKKVILTHCCEVTISTPEGHNGKGNECAPTKEEACGKARDKALEEAFGK